jgi:hypothetical protein
MEQLALFPKDEAREFPETHRYANKKELAIIAETFGLEHKEAIEYVLNDIFDLYQYASLDRDTYGNIYQCIGLSCQKAGHAYLLTKEGSVYLLQVMCLFPVLNLYDQQTNSYPSLNKLQ